MMRAMRGMSQGEVAAAVSPAVRSMSVGHAGPDGRGIHHTAGLGRQVDIYNMGIGPRE